VKSLASSKTSRRSLLKAAISGAAVLPAGVLAEALPAAPPTPANDREYWLRTMERISSPLLEALAKNQLRATMPVECAAGTLDSRRECTHLEAFGRLLCGLAPWLELEGCTGSEAALQTGFRELARNGIANGTDPASPDHMNFGTNQQSLVDTAFLALAILRAPEQLWHKLDRAVRQRVIDSFRATRVVLPGHNNWLLFSATIEAFFCFASESWDALRIDYAIEQHQQWYAGDGAYGDGPHFHWDYYNSFVIQPMLLAILDVMQLKHDQPKTDPKSDHWNSLRPAILERAQRYAAIQERLISPEGTYPAIGRSLAYRFGAFHHLADISLRRQLPQGVAPEQVRSALTAVMRRMIEAPGTFNAKGWLTIGFAGHQPSIGETYISTGSLYLCSVAWLPLGLPATDPFWSAPPRPWTSQKAWGGTDLPTDHAISD
jgi:hypothetical protein